jgi:NTP pyrophosphatase (non-canonical NTP hydrolase)
MSTQPPASPITLRAFQETIRERFYEADARRGIPGTWLWFSEEVGELARALARGNDPQNLAEEFADVLAWLCTMANVSGVDLTKAVEEKYFGEKANLTPK